MSLVLARKTAPYLARAYGPSMRKYSRYGERARMARTVATFAYKNRAPMISAAKKIQRAVRRRQKNRSKVGRPVGVANAKRTANVSPSTENVYERTLYGRQVTFPNAGQNIDQRERKIINVSGIKICQEFLVTNSTLNQPLYLNIAFVRNKQSPAATSVPLGEFFRGNGDERHRSFSSLTQGIDYHCANLNTDQFDVWFHKRYITRFDTNDPKKNLVRLMHFVKINRQISFDDTGAPDTRLWILWWCSIAGRDNVTPGAAIQMNTNFHDITYFRETRN